MGGLITLPVPFSRLTLAFRLPPYLPILRCHNLLGRIFGHDLVATRLFYTNGMLFPVADPVTSWKSMNKKIAMIQRNAEHPTTKANFSAAPNNLKSLRTSEIKFLMALNLNECLLINYNVNIRNLIELSKLIR